MRSLAAYGGMVRPADRMPVHDFNSGKLRHELYRDGCSQGNNLDRSLNRPAGGCGESGHILMVCDSIGPVGTLTESVT